MFWCLAVLPLYYRYGIIYVATPRFIMSYQHMARQTFSVFSGISGWQSIAKIHLCTLGRGEVIPKGIKERTPPNQGNGDDNDSMTIFGLKHFFSKKKNATLGIWISARRKADFSVDPEDSEVTQLVMEGVWAGSMTHSGQHYRL